jgi:hypothetical protein
MARIRIVDEWLRSPASPPTYYRAIMVVAERWAEQRVLMRAYSDSVDQTRPTIVLHGQELAIGPSSLDPNGPWGIHVQPPVDGRAQSLKDALELAARRMAGSKGNPPRLEDEVSDLERKRTNNWAPGDPRDVVDHRIPGPSWEPSVAASLHASASAGTLHASTSASGLTGASGATATGASGAMATAASGAMATAASGAMATTGHVTSSPGAATVFPPLAHAEPGRWAVPVPQHQVAAFVPAAPAAEMVPMGAQTFDGPFVTAPHNPAERRTPVRWLHERQARVAHQARTQLGYSSGAGAQSAVIRLGLRPAVAARLARLVDRTVPSDFEITQLERTVLNAIGERGRLTARAIGELVGVVDGVAWMESFVDKLERYGLDLVAPGEASGSEPTYVLRV